MLYTQLRDAAAAAAFSKGSGLLAWHRSGRLGCYGFTDNITSSRSQRQSMVLLRVL